MKNVTINTANSILGLLLFIVFAALPQGVSAQSANPVVVSRVIDYPHINSIDSGTAYLDIGAIKSRLETVVSENGAVSIGYATDTITYILEYSADLQYQKTMEFANEWTIEYVRSQMIGDVLGVMENSFSVNFTKDNSGNYYIFYARDVRDTDKDVENQVVVKYDKTGKRVGAVYQKAWIKETDTHFGVKWPSPHRIEISGNLLAVFFTRTGFIGGDGINHDSSHGFTIDLNKFEIIHRSIRTASHSMDRFLLPTQGGFVYVDQGDGFPRNFAFTKSNGVEVRTRNSPKFKEGKVYQATYASVGGIAEMANGYIFAGTQEKNNVTSSSFHNDSRNVLLFTMDKDMYTISDPIWFTDYRKKETDNAGSVKIVSLSPERALLMWELMAYTGYKTTYFTTIDASGKRLTDIKELPNIRLNRDDALRYNKKTGNVYWTTNQGGDSIDLIAFNPDKPINIQWKNNNLLGGHGYTITNFDVSFVAGNKASLPSIRQNELFTVDVVLSNTLPSEMPAGQVGIVVVDEQNNILHTICTADFASVKAHDYKALSHSGYGSKANLKCFIPATVKPGNYRLRTVYRPSNKEWKIVTIVGPYAKVYTSSVPFTLTAEKKEADNSYKLSIDKFTSKLDEVFQDEKFTVNCKLKNNTADKLAVEVGAALIDANDNIVDVIGSKSVSLKANSLSGSITLDCSAPGKVSPSQYRLRLVARATGKKWEVITKSDLTAGTANSFDITISSNKAIYGNYGYILKGFTQTIDSFNKEGAFRLSWGFGNADKTDSSRYTGETGAVLVDSRDNLICIVIKTKGGGLYHGNVSIPKTVPAGKYKLKMAIKPEGKEWRIGDLLDDGIVNSIDITVPKTN